MRRHLRIRRAAIAVGLIAVYSVTVLSVGIADRLILYPTTHRLTVYGAERKTIAFRNGSLEVWLGRSKNRKEQGEPDVLVLRFYGNADRADRWAAVEADMWGDRAVEVWGVNYPGFGGSTGPARLSGIAPAAVAAFDALKQRAGNRPIIVFGTSIGTTAALHIAANRDVSGLILHNPPALRQMIIRQFGWWNLWLLAGPVAAQIPAQLDNIANANRARVPAVFLLAERDEIVAPRFQRQVVDAYAGEKRIIRLTGAGHNSPIEGTAIAELHHGLEWLLAGKPMNLPANRNRREAL